jgi:hypothetical protein
MRATELKHDYPSQRAKHKTRTYMEQNIIAQGFYLEKSTESFLFLPTSMNTSLSSSPPRNTCGRRAR